ATLVICERNDLEDCVWDITDENGQYDISGLTSSSTYQLEVYPDIDSSISFLQIYPFVMTADTAFDITLSAGATISGTVLSSDNAAISNARVQVVSNSTGFFQETTTGIDGSYEFTQSPDVTDYEITASADGYIESSLTDQTASDDIDFSLEAGGTISGEVTDASSGEYIEGAIVEIYSYANHNAANYGGIAVTNSLGQYSVDQLKITDESGDTIADYVVTANATAYPAQTNSGIMTGDTVNLYMYAETDQSIGITITDASGLINEYVTVIASIFDDDGYYGRKSIDTLSGFQLTGLSSDKNYSLLFTAYSNSEEILSQWASTDGTGVFSQDQAGTFAVGDLLQFVFQPNLRRSLKNTNNAGPGPVRDLRSITHDYRHINKRLRSIDSSNTSTVSNDPNITVTWDAPDEGEDDLSGYYTDFNVEDSYSHSAFNTVTKPVIRTRKITSSDLEGDDVSYYFHVAAVDVEGRIGQTTSIAFRIDTIAPTNVNVTAPDSATDRNIALVLGATGASDVYISNINYEESGDWDNLSTEKEWKLSRGDGIKTIYVRFRDAAGNTSDTMTVTSYTELLENSGPMISDRTFTVSDSLTDGLYVGIVEATDADDDPLTFTISTGSMTEGFGLNSDSGLLFVDQANIFPETPGTYDLTVTVQDSEESSSAKVRVNVTAGNYPPEIANQSFSIDEHSPVSTPIAMLEAIDADGDTITFSIISGNSPEIFSLNSETGVLSVQSSTLLDYENQASIVLTIGASDSQITQTAQITINLNNINDNTPDIQSQSFIIDEQAENQSIIGQIVVSDADGQTPVCAINSGNDSNAFSLDEQSCELKVNDTSKLDYEQGVTSFVLNISASDGSLSNASPITVNIRNINDNPPEIESQNFTVMENTIEGIIVYTIAASDPDQLSALVYQFIKPDENLPFSLEQETGIIKVKSLIDYESQSTYTLTVQVFDNKYTAIAEIIISVLNENDNAPKIEDHQFYVSETIANKTIIGNLKASDADGDSLTYSLLINTDDFTILPETRLQIINNEIIDSHEQGGVFNLTVSVSDGLYTDSGIIHLSITPVNDHAPLIEDINLTISESTSPGTMISSIIATDEDQDLLTFSITAGNTNNSFTIAENSGQLFVDIKAQLDYETQSEYTLTIRVWDGAFDTNANVFVHISNSNDNPPETSDLNCTLLENTPQETPVCQVSGKDTDNDTLYFSIISETEAFMIEPLTGMIIVKNHLLLDYETIQAYTIQTAVTDNTYTVTQQTIIQLINENDNLPELTVLPIETLEDTPVNTCIQWSDADGDQLTLVFQTQGDYGILKQSEKNCLSYTPNSNVNGLDSLQLTAFDGLHTSDPKTLTITIIAVNDPPTLSPIENISIFEDTPSDLISIFVTDIDNTIDELNLDVLSDQISLIPNNKENIKTVQTDKGYSLQLIPVADQSGSSTLTVTVSDELTSVSTNFICTVIEQNDPPEISAFAAITINEDISSNAISFTISDNETNAEDLYVTVYSYNSNLIPNDNKYLALSGTDNLRQLIVNPLPDMFGISIIQVNVNDGSQSVSSLLTVTVLAVNDPPEINAIDDIQIDEDIAISPIILDISDKESPVSELNISIETDNFTLLPNSGLSIDFNSEKNTYALTIKPVANTSGNSQLTVTVSDGELSVSTAFQLTVNPVNDPPVISTIPNQTIAENTSTGPIQFTVTDLESHIDDLLISINSSNTDLIPINESHVLIANQNLTLTPVSFASGSTHITITVDDGHLQAHTSFLLQVTSVDQSPVISNISDQSFDEDTSMQPLALEIWDPETPIENLNVWAESSNISLFPVSSDNIKVNYHDNVYWIELTPAKNQFGTSTVTVYADDGFTVSYAAFDVNVLPVEDMPVLIPPLDIQIQEDSGFQSIAFQADDPETPANDLIITAISDNTALISQESIAITGTTNNKWLTLSVTPGNFGIANIYMTLADAAGNTQTHTQTITVLRGNTLAFNGENDYVEIMDHESIQINENLTVEAWIMPCTITSIDRTIVNKINAQKHGVSLSLISENYLQVIAGNNTQSWTLTSVRPVPGNVWTHVAASITTQGISIFINAKKDAELNESISLNLNQGSPLIFGGQSDNPTSASFCGQMDDIRLWKAARTENDISLYMNQRLQGDETSLAGYWHFKDSEANDYCSLNDDHYNHGIIHKDAPMLSMIPDQWINEDTDTENINFTVSDLQTQAENLIVKVQSSDGSLVSDSNIILSGTGKNRALQISPNANQWGSCNITVSVNDGETITSRTFLLTVLPINDPPYITMTDNISVLEDSIAQSIGFQLTDVDNLLDDLSISVNTSDSQILPLKNIMISKSGQWLSFTPTSQQSGSLQLSLTVSDGQLFDTAMLTISITPVNDIPIISNISDREILEDANEISIPFSIQDVETDADQLQLSIEYSPSNGDPFSSLYLSGTGTERYLHAVPASNQSGSLMITLTLSDDNQEPAKTFQSFLLKVLPVNDSPIMTKLDDLTIYEDAESVDIFITVQDIESESSALNITAISLNNALIPQNSIFITAMDMQRQIHFSPKANMSGMAGIEVILSDPDGKSVSSTFSVTVEAVNDTPIIQSTETITFNEDTPSAPITINVSDIETANEDLIVWAKSKNTHLINENGILLSTKTGYRELILSPIENKSGVAMIEIGVSDNEGLTQIFMLTCTVLAINDAPVIAEISDIIINEDTASEPIILSLTDLETQISDISIEAISDQNEILSIDDIQLTYEDSTYFLTITPKANIHGQSKLCLIAYDSEGLSDTTCFDVEILAVNDLPTISEISNIYVNEDSDIPPIEFFVSDIETPLEQLYIQVDISDKTLISIDDVPIQGKTEKRTLYISANENTSGSTWVSLTLNDFYGGIVSTKFLVDIAQINDAPTIENIKDITVIEDQAITPLTLSVKDIETPVENLIVDVFSNSEILPNSALNLYYNTEINAHVLTFSITPDTFGDTDITIQVSDPEGLSVSTAFQVHQLAVNDAPKIGEISDQTILEDSLSLAIPISITDVETSAQNMNLHVSLAFVNVVNYQDFSVSNDGKFIANFTTIPNAFGSDTITVMTSDAEGLTAIINFTINVLAVNDPPTIQAINDQGSDEDAILGPFPFFIDDIDNPKDSLIVKVSIHNSELSNYSQITNQTLTLIPEKDQHGSTDVLISVSDPDGLTSSTKFTWIVYPQKDSPIIADISNIIINEDTEKTSIPFSASHVDYNYNDLAFELLSDAPNIIDPEKQKIDESMLIITPEPDQFGIVQLCLVATDPNPLSAQSCFSVTIVSQNDPPVISASKDYTINEDNILNIPFFVEDIDSEIDISMINCSVDTNVAQVSKAILLADNFSISLTPDKDYFGNFNLEISVNDTQGGTDQIIVQILVQAVNDAPLAHPGEWTVFEDLSVTRQLTATDIDGDSLTYTISTAPQYGSIQLLDDHKVYYEPKPNFSGIDRFSFYVSDSLAISSPAWITLTIDDTPDTPVANAGSNLTVNELQEVKLDGYLSNDPDQDIISYQWQQTDGVLVSLTDTDQIAISFIAPDVTNDQDLSFEIFVTDKTGRSHKDSVVVHVLDLSPPTAGFQASSEEGLVPHEVQFTDTSVGKIDTWLWEFGDGYISREPHPMHIYSKSGEYTVILTVSGPNGSRTKERIDYIQAKAAELKAEFMATPINGVAPLTVNFSDLSEGEVEQMTWNFGDNNQSSTPSPVHTYEMPGEYTVTLTIYDAQSVDHIEKPFFISVSDRKIQGRITSNENSDQKLENYFVIAYGENFNIKTLSDINGNYTLTGLPAVNNIKLGVFPPANDDEFLSQFYNEKDSLNDADKLSTEESDLNNIDIYLKPMPSLKITGRVHNGYQGKEKLNVSVFSDEIQWGAENQTDMDGNYTLTGLKPATDYKLSVWWEEQNTLVYYALPSDGIVGQDIPTFSQFEENLSTTFEMTEQNLVHMDIILSMSNNTISGQLVNENGKGIANIWVNAWSSALETGNAALSDNQGHYTIMGLPPVSQDEVIDKGYQLTIQSNGYQAYPELVFVPSSGINFSLKTTTWISGKVISDNGEAIQSACIHLWSASDLLNNIYSSCTDDTGNYTVNGLSFASDYIVKVTAPNFPDYYYENTNDLNMASHLDLSTGPLTTVNFTLLSGGIITGQVFIESNDQKAFSGIWVNVWSPSADISRQVQTDNTGVFQFNSLDKSITDYYIMIQDSNYLPAFYCDTAENNTTTQKDLATPVKTNDQIYEIVLKSGLKVCGTITGGFDLSKEFQLTARSENFGIYQPTNIPAGDTPAFCIDHLTADYYNFSLYQGQQMILTQSMLVIANMNQLELSVAEQSLGKISGQVQGLPENVWAQIRVWSDSLQMEKNIRILGTGSSINYSIENLPRASDYAAVFSSDDLPDQYFDQTYHQSQAKVIDISKNDFDNTHFIIQENSGSIYGKIYFSNDLPIDGLIKIKAWSQSLGTVVQKNMQLSSANNIAYSLTKLEKATDYIVSVEADGYIYQYYSDSIKPALAQKLDLETETIKLDINFYLTKGVNLSGKVETTLSLEALTVEAENQIDGQIFSVPLSIDGNYNLQGLFADKNYLLWVRHDNGSRWYYADTQSLMNKDLAIWVTPSSLQSYDFVIQTNKSIAGNVKSSTGDPISGVWVEAKNVTGKISGGSYTADDGSYEIPFLMDQTYLVSANPDANSFFKSMEKSDIQAGTLSVNFILEKNSGAVLSGTVSNLQTSVESLARITVIDEQGKSIQTVSDRNGNYIINGLEIENKYYINVFPSSESNAAFLKTSVEISENNQTLDLELSAGVNMQGQVIDLASNKPIDEATVIYQSESTGYYNIIQTDESGGFELFSMPDTMDYDVRVISANHQSINLINQQPSQYRLFEMISSGSVVGTLIHNQSGNGIAGAVVHIQSATRGIERSALTHSNGEFILSGLIEKDEQGQAITDYVLTVIANQYPIKTFRNVQTGQERIIRLSQSQGKRIRARIKNTNDENWIVDIFKNQGDFVQTQVVQTNQWFECMGLDSSITYQLRITNISQTQQYWIGESGNLQDNRAQAESISIPSQVDIQAPENNTKRNIRKMFETFQSTLTAPEITSTSHGIFTPETPNVSSIPVIEMAWTLSSIENILGYYVVFNDQADFEWDKSNASGYHIIPLTGLNSPEFSGNETSVYCHIAAVDNMGDIGPTGHAGPYVIDTVSPENIYIIAPSTTPTRSIQINLHASDAQEIYLSTLGYDTGSSWQPYIQTLTFLLPAETGKHMIYASFRDRARNTSRSHTALLLESPENTMPIASSQTFNVIEDKTYSSKLTGYDENGDSLQYSIQNLPEHGTLTLLDSITGDFSYAPEKDYFGQDYFTFSVNDGATNSVASQCTLTIQNQNDEPQVFSSEFSVEQNSSYLGQLQAIDIDQDILTYEIFAKPAKGIVRLTNPQTGEFQYIPNTDTFGKDSFLFNVNDGEFTPQPEIVKVEIIPAATNNTWYSGWYPEGFIVDKNNIGLENILITFYGKENISYTTLTDENGYFVLETQKEAESNYALKASGKNIADIWISWPQDDPPQTYTLLSVLDSNTVLLASRKYQNM
ncbi:Cadherin domain protein, partial [Candidatus Magnetomorum sp. HK-1]